MCVVVRLLRNARPYAHVYEERETAASSGGKENTRTNRRVFVNRLGARVDTTQLPRAEQAVRACKDGEQ